MLFMTLRALAILTDQYLFQLLTYCAIYQRGDDSVWDLMIVFCIYFINKVFSNIVFQVKTQFGSLKPFVCYLKEYCMLLIIEDSA